MKKFFASIFVASLSFILINTIAAQNALHFDGVNDRVYSKFDGISGNKPRTIEAWIHTTYVSGLEVITTWGSPGNNFTFSVNSGFLRILNGPSSYTSTAMVADTSWQHVAITFNDSLLNKYSLYLNGNLIFSIDLSASTNTGAMSDLIIGMRNDNKYYWKGKIDELRIWDYDRSATQILNNMNRELCLTEPGLKAYYKFNQGLPSGNNAAINKLIDYAVKPHDGTLLNLDSSSSV